MSSFPCTKCGACCKLAGVIPNFPEPVLPGTTRCVHLSASSQRCVVYKSRPKECRIVNSFPENAAVCNVLQVITNTPQRYRLPVLDKT